MYTLINGEKMSKMYPDTFEIPNTKRIKKLKSGDYVKLGFEEEGKQTERMWVKVIRIGNGINYYKGVLNNAPYNLLTIKLGDEVIFNTDHILNIMTNNDKPKVMKQYKKLIDKGKLK